MHEEADPFERFMQVHAMLHPEGKAIEELRASGVGDHRVLALYPFELTGWLDVLFETVAPSSWDTLRVTLSEGKISNGWLDSVQQLNHTLTSTLYGEWESFSATAQGDHLRVVIEDVMGNYQYKELTSRNVSMVLFETMTVVSRWNQLAQMHRWKETEDILLAVLSTIVAVHAEGLTVLSALDQAHVESGFNQ